MGGCYLSVLGVRCFIVWDTCRWGFVGLVGYVLFEVSLGVE